MNQFWILDFGFSKLVVVASTLLFALSTNAQAQQARKPAHIAFLSSLSPSAVSDRIEAFRRGLRELGYIEGQSILIDWRYAEGRSERLKKDAAELVRIGVDVIVTGGPAVNRYAKEATSTIPVVLAFDNDPVGNGFAASLCSSWRQHYWAINELSGNQRKTAGDSQGDNAETRARRGCGQFHRTGECPGRKRK